MRKKAKTRRVIAAFALAGALALGGFVAAPLQALAAPVTSRPADDSNVVDTETLTIRYRLGKDGNLIHETYVAELPKGKEYSVKSPDVEGFSLADEEQRVVSGTLDDDVDVEVLYNYTQTEAKYTVEYVGYDSNGNPKKLADSETFFAPVGSKVTVPYRAFAGYVKRGDQDMTLTVTADGNAKKTLVYDEKLEQPYILFNTGGSYVAPITAKPGADTTAQISAVQEPTRSGYEFKGWLNENNESVDLSSITKMPEADLVLTAGWSPVEISYTVLYWFENADDDDYTLNTGLNDNTRKELPGELVEATAEDVAKGEASDPTDAFYGFDFNEEKSVAVEVTPDGNAVLNLYYDREIWTINLYENAIGYKETDWEDYQAILKEKKHWKSFSGKYGSKAPDDFPTYEERVAHYDDSSLGLNPWTGSGYGLIDVIIPSASPEENWSGGIQVVTLADLRRFDNESEKGSHTLDCYPYYRRNPHPHTVHYFAEPLYDASSDYTGWDYRSEMALTSVSGTSAQTFNLEKPEGFTFEGGIYRFSNAGFTESDWLAAKNPCGPRDDGSLRLMNITFRHIGVWMKRERYDIVFMNGDEEIERAEDVPYEMPLDEYLEFIPGEEKAPVGTEFAGWYVSPELFNESGAHPMESGTMPAYNLTLYAKWEPKTVTVSFDTRGGDAIAAQEVAYNSAAQDPGDPKRGNDEFTGWYTEPTGGERWSFDRPVEADITLYAHWRGDAEASLTVKHVIVGDEGPFKAETISSSLGDTVFAAALDSTDEAYPGKESYLVPMVDGVAADSISVTLDAANREVTFEYKNPAERTYVVKYLEKGTDKALEEETKVTTTNSVVTETAAKIEGYEPDAAYKVFNVTSDSALVFYYSKNGGGAEAPEITLTPQDMVAYTGGNSLGGDSFPATRYLVEAVGGADLSELEFTVEGKDYVLPEGAESGDVVVLPWLPDVFTFVDSSELGSSDVAEGTSVMDDLAAGDYSISIDEAKVEASAGGATVTFGTGGLIVRDVSDPAGVIEAEVDIAQPVLDSEDNVDTSDDIGVAVVDDATSYYTNGDEELQLLGDTESDEPQISLLFDMPLPGEEGEDTVGLLRERASKDGYELTDENSEFRYLDLVNENDGNAWVSTDDGVEIKIYWPVPEGVDPNGVEFSVLHFEDLHRQYRENLDEQIRDCDVVRIDDVSVDETGENVVFTLVGDQDEGCFSPFALTWSPKNDEPSDPEPEEPEEPDTPGQTDPDPDEPENPDSDEPDTPDDPDTPEEPEEPDTPDNPDLPEDPDEPDTPDTPDEPGEPDKPEEPGEPSEPSEPAKPSKPGRPEAIIPQTGDLLGAIAPLVGLAGAGTVCAGAALNRRRKR